MILTLRRFASMIDWTLSAFYIDGQFQCFGLEDEHRDQKVPGETRIPAGRYEIKLQTVGVLHNKYSARFAGVHVGMLALQNVPGFAGVMIHVGNTDDDTEGCILLGDVAMASGALGDSVAGYRKAYAKISDKLRRGEKVFIDVLDQ